MTLLGDAAPVLSNNVIEQNLATGGTTSSARGGGLYAYISQGAAGTLRIESGNLLGIAAPAAGGCLWFLCPAPAPPVLGELLT